MFQVGFFYVVVTFAVCSLMNLLVCSTVPSLMHFLPHFPNLSLGVRLYDFSALKYWLLDVS